MSTLREVAQQALEAPGCARLREWASIGPVQRAAVESFLQAALAQREPVAWIQPDHLQKARRAPFLCRVEPTQRCADFVPIYTAPPRPTGLPHCERSCEANAFQIEIRRLQAALEHQRRPGFDQVDEGDYDLGLDGRPNSQRA